MPSNDTILMAALNDIWDCPPEFKDVTKWSGEVTIVNPCLNILAGVQPGYLSFTFPPVTYEMGFMSRMLLIYSEDTIKLNLFGDVRRSLGTKKKLLEDLQQMRGVSGVYQPTLAYAEAIQEWTSAGCPPKPEHSRLAHYAARRHIMTVKLSMIHSMSLGSGLALDLPNFEWARTVLLEAETRMPKVFAAMGNSDDAGVVEEVWQLLSRRGVMTGSEITRYLQQKVGPQRSWQTLLSLVQGAVIVKTDDNSIANMMEGGEHTVWRYVAGVKPETF